MYKGWAIKLALAPRPLMIYYASPLAAAMIITVAVLRIVLAHGSKPLVCQRVSWPDRMSFRELLVFNGI
jgi:hypothetical protein